MRILQIHNFYQWAGGEDVVVHNERFLLESAGHMVELYAVDNATISAFGAKIKTFRNVTYSKEERRRLANYLPQFSPDIVHVHNFFPLLSPSIYDACVEHRVPIIQTLHNYRPVCAAATLFRDGHLCDLCVKGHPYHAVLHRCYRGSALGSLAVANMIFYHRRHQTWSKAVTRFIALTNFACGRFVEAGFPAERIVVKPNFTEDPGEPCPEGRHGALFVGRLTPEKGVSILLKAWSGMNYPLRIIGDGPNRASLEARAPPHVIFEGRVTPDGVSKAMRTASLIVLPSLWYEGLPMTLVEAFANGLPVVASRLGAFPELVEEGLTGRLFAPGDPDSLARTVRELIESPTERHAMSIRARCRFEAHYTAAQNLELLSAIYQDAMDAHH